jgi:sensor histidine kinase regulating citrate/malate metabolism
VLVVALLWAAAALGAVAAAALVVRVGTAVHAGHGVSAWEWLATAALLAGGAVAAAAGWTPSRAARFCAERAAHERELIEFARGYRHSLMNHLQVLSGWLQLGRGDRAMSYVERLVGDLERERGLLQRGGPRLAALFVSRAARAGTGAVAVNYDVDDEFERACARYSWLAEAAGTLIDALGQRAADGTPCAALDVRLFARAGSCGVAVTRRGVGCGELESMASGLTVGRAPVPLGAAVRRAGGRLLLRDLPDGVADLRIALPWRGRGTRGPRRARAGRRA